MRTTTRSLARAGFQVSFLASFLALAGTLLAAQALAQDFKLGGITVSAPWARATPGGAKVAGAFLEIRAEAGVEDRLVAARSPASGVVEIHDHVDDGGVMKMRRVDGIAIKGSQSVVLKPGGLHIMMLDLAAPLKEGDSVAFTLVFEKAGELQITVPVAKIGAAGPGGAPEHGAGHGAHHGMGSGSGAGK